MWRKARGGTTHVAALRRRHQSSARRPVDPTSRKLEFTRDTQFQNQLGILPEWATLVSVDSAPLFGGASRRPLEPARGQLEGSQANLEDRCNFHPFSSVVWCTASCQQVLFYTANLSHALWTKHCGGEMFASS